MAIAGRPAEIAPLEVYHQEVRQLVVGRLGLLEEPAFDACVEAARKLRIPLLSVLVERARIPNAFLLQQLARAWGMRFIDLRTSDVSREALATVREDYARARGLIPFKLEGRELHVAMADPRARHSVDDVERMTGWRIVAYLVPEAALRRAQLLYAGDLREMLARAADDESLRLGQSSGTGDEDSAVRLVKRVLEYAAVAEASDIHVEPYDLQVLIRYRIDGVLHEVLTLPTAALPSMVARIKVLAGMRIDERRLPQDGSFSVDLGGFTMDLRVSSLPTRCGEKVVLRVLPRDRTCVDLEDLGLTAPDLALVQRATARPFGMVLVTGPTGSGKSTSLYAMLTRVAAERQNSVNISTIEDPIEYSIARVNQVAVNPAAGLDFATALRAFLRQDPDVVMVGEIRDRETAEMAVRSALIGRLLLSTLHTNDATSAVPRLIDMGVEPFLVASTLALVVGQRLVRRICLACRESIAPDPAVIATLTARADYDATVQVLQRDGVLRDTADPLAAVRLFRGRGCVRCQNTGFRGRLGVFELLEIDDELRALVMARPDGGTIRARALAKGMKSMFQDGLAKAILGETTLDEVLRVSL